MKLTANAKRILSAMLVFMMVFSLVPMNVLAASDTPIDAAVIFTDLHTSKSNYKQSNVNSLFGALKNSGLPISSVTSGGDAFSVNDDSGKYTGYTGTITGYIHDALGDDSIPVNYVWSDHDRYAVQEDGVTLLDKTSHLVYGAGNDGVYGTGDDGNYYIYLLSMADTSTNDRYNAGLNSTTVVKENIAKFKIDIASLDESKPLLIVAHQPLLDNRNDNGHAYLWATAINEVAQSMDVAYFFGHNHKYDKSSDYYYAKGSTMSVCSDSSGNAKNVVLNFAHICAGYAEPTSTGSYSSSGTRRNTVMAVVLYEDSIQYTTYTNTGIYTGSYALNVTVARDHASAQPESPEVPETTVPEATEPETTVPEATEPETPDVPVEGGKIWRKASSITAGQRYMLVNYGYNASNVGTFAVGSDAAPVSVEVKTDDNGAYIVSDDLALAWTASASGSYFLLNNAETGANLRSTGTAYSGTNAELTVAQTSGSSIYNCWSMETKNNKQVLSVRRSSSSNYYPVCLNNAEFQVVNSSKVSSMNNWLALFVETEETAHQHSFETITVAATCTQEGSVTTVCACGVQTVEKIPANGHSYACTETAATCAQNGSKVYTCTVCADTYTEVIPATGEHVYEATVVAATCTEDGLKTEVCGVCGKTVTEVIPALGHSFEAVVTVPTCTEAGYTTYTCACGETYVADEVAALGHSYTAETVEPTCVKEGYTIYTCVCGESYTEIIPATGEHVYEATVVAATCTEDGVVTYTCDCGESYTEIIPATGHSYHAVVTAPTCENAGYTTYTCACGETYVADEVAALGHSYNAVVTAPTCENAGYTTYTCTCGESYVADEVAALGHSYNAVVTAPTCENAGYTTYTCACGDSYTADQVAALGHSYTAVESDGYMVYTCHCGHSYSEKLTPDLSYVKVSALSDDSYVITLTSGGKYYALSHKNNAISVVQVTVSNNQITSEVTEELVWSFSGGKLSYVSGGRTYYLYAQPASGWFAWFSAPTLTISTSNSTTVSLSSNKLKMSNYYLTYSNNSVSLNWSGTTAALFAETEN